jgi:hypothetical protein
VSARFAREVRKLREKCAMSVTKWRLVLMSGAGNLISFAQYTLRATGAWSMLHPENVRKVDRTVRDAAKKHVIRLYRFANVGSHLHFLIQARTREAFRAFVREVSGAIAFEISGAKEAQPLEGKFWDLLPFSRVVSWGRDFKGVTAYIIGNLLEAAGLWNRKRDSFLKVILASMLNAGVGPPPRSPRFS